MARPGNGLGREAGRVLPDDPGCTSRSAPAAPSRCCARRTPRLAELILDLISLDYHETLFAAAGHQAEAALQAAMKQNDGKYVCVVEGAIPTKTNGIYCMIGGRTAMDIAQGGGGKAGAIIAIGSCASCGGIPSADPNPTGATGAPRC